MKSLMILKHEFVEYVPRELQEGTIYVSIAFSTVIHNCCCGCGTRVVTPISPAEWTLLFDGRSISLYPSIGNWSFRCRSHYWIRNNRVIWARPWSQNEIAAGRRNDTLELQQYFHSSLTPSALAAEPTNLQDAKAKKNGFVQWLKRLLRRT